MTKANWVSPSEVELYFPPTPEDFMAVADDVNLILGDNKDRDFWDWAPKYHGDYVLVYLHDEPVGQVRLDSYKKTIHMHGSLRPEYEDRGIVQIVVNTMLKYIFNSLQKEAVLITIDDNEPTLKGFASQWGFRFSHKDKDGSVYRLNHADYLQRIANV